MVPIDHAVRFYLELGFGVAVVVALIATLINSIGGR